MRLILHHPQEHDSADKKSSRKERKGQRILKKMAKLEKKLRRYGFNESSSGKDSAGSSRSSRSSSRSGSRSPEKPRSKRASCRRGDKDFGAGNSVSDSDSNLSNSATPRSLSGHQSRRRTTSHSLPRSRSPADADNYSALLARKHYRHRRSYHLQDRDKLRNNYQNGILSSIFRELGQSEPNLQTASTEPQTQEVEENSEDFENSSASPERKSELPEMTNLIENESGRKVLECDGKESEAHPGNSEQETEDRTLSKDSLDVIQNGLPIDKKKYLLGKYEVNKSCGLLKGPKINEEVLPVAREAAIRRDVLQMYEQNQLGAGLVALGQAIYDLNEEFDKTNNKNIANILETLNEAAAIFLDAHHNITTKRQLLMLPELNKKVRSVVKHCRADEWLYGFNLGARIKNAKIFRKGEKNGKRCVFEKSSDKSKTSNKHPDKDGQKLPENS